MNLLIGTETQEEFDAVLAKLENTLQSGYWKNYKSETYIRVTTTQAHSYGSLDYAKAHDEKVTPYKEWAAKNIKPTTKSESNMKYVVEVNSNEEAAAVYKQNAKAAVEWTRFPMVVTSSGSWNGNISYHKQADTIEVYGPLISFKTFSEMFGIKLKPNKTLKLTSDYTAEVNYNTKIVQVGCQSIPFTVVEALAKLIKE